MSPTREDFEAALTRIMDRAAKNGKKSVSVSAKSLHELVGGYPGPDHRMPVCCSVMRSYMEEGDRVLNSPPKGNGASLKIHYRLNSPQTQQDKDITKDEAHAMFAAAAFQAMLAEKLRQAKSRKLPNPTYGKIAAEAWKAGKIMLDRTPKS